MKNVRHVDIVVVVLLLVVLGCMLYMCVTNKESFDAHGQTKSAGAGANANSTACPGMNSGQGAVPGPGANGRNGRSPCENLSGESRIRCEKDLALRQAGRPMMTQASMMGPGMTTAR